LYFILKIKAIFLFFKTARYALRIFRGFQSNYLLL